MLRQRQFINRKSRHGGFTLIEVMVSLVVLAIGLLGVAALISGTLQSGTRAKYMSMANILASEKLDSLDQWGTQDINGTITPDPNIQAGGVLNANPCAAGDSFCDTVTVNEASGADYETQTVNGTTTTVVHTSSGCVDTPADCGVANPPAGGATFTRRWLISWGPSITLPGGGTSTAAGVRQITVLVTLNDASVNPPVKFQMSMVRP